jgi:hypothetical protein
VSLMYTVRGRTKVVGACVTMLTRRPRLYEWSQTVIEVRVVFIRRSSGACQSFWKMSSGPRHGLPVDQHERRSRQGRLSSRSRSAQRQIERPGVHSHDGERASNRDEAR